MKGFQMKSISVIALIYLLANSLNMHAMEQEMPMPGRAKISPIMISKNLAAAAINIPKSTPSSPVEQNDTPEANSWSASIPTEGFGPACFGNRSNY